MKKLTAFFTIFCILGVGFRLYAHGEKPFSVPALEQSENLEKTVVSAEDYILMPGDSILITITGSTNYSYITAVTLEGKVTIRMPVSSTADPRSLIGPTGLYEPQFDVVSAVPMYDITLETAKDSLKRAFLKYFRNIDVDITLLSMRTFMVIVAGEVRRPGIALARPIDRVSTVIDSVRGVTTIGSRAKIQLIRKGKLFKIVNLEEFERIGNTEANSYVQDGDLIYVPRMEKSVVVRGAVFGKRGYELRVAELTAARERTSEGLYELTEGEKVSDIITKAGGITPWADLINVYIERNDQKLMINLEEVITDENSRYNLLMEDGDVLVVPSVNAVVYVQGQVVNPGSFIFQPNLQASDYIGLAGGPLAEASMSGAYVQREKKKLSIKNDPVIEQGDRIYVPRQIFKFWQDYVEIGAVIVSILISYLTLTAN